MIFVAEGKISKKLIKYYSIVLIIPAKGFHTVSLRNFFEAKRISPIETESTLTTKFIQTYRLLAVST